jgi:hypothetical protein
MDLENDLQLFRGRRSGSEHLDGGLCGSICGWAGGLGVKEFEIKLPAGRIVLPHSQMMLHQELRNLFTAEQYYSERVRL